MMKEYGIYRLISPSGKCYIGQSLDIKRRLNTYKRNVNKEQRLLYNAICKYGFENFNVEILWSSNEDEDKNIIKELLNHLEIGFMKIYKSLTPRGYNLRTGGESYLLSDETKKKISEGNKGIKNGMYGRKVSNETKKKISESGKGRIVSEETRIKNSKANKGKIISDEVRKKISKNSKSNTDEVKRKISESQIKRMSNRDNSHSDETREKISNALKGRKLSEEHKKKIGENSRNMSAETREKISKSLKKRYEKK